MTERPVTVRLPVIDDIDDNNDHGDAGRVTRFDVERFACGELVGDARARVEAALAADPALRAFYDDVVASDRAFLATAPPAAFLARLEAASASVATSNPLARAWAAVRRLVSGPTLAAACAATAVLFVVVTNDGDGGGDITTENPGLRSKGGAGAAGLGFFVKDDSGAHAGNDGDPLRHGDRIQFAVTDPATLPSSPASAPPRALVVVGIDATGAVATYAREAVDAVRPKGNTPRVLGLSLVLDDAVGAERYFAVWGNDLAATEAAAVDAARTLAERVRRGTSPASVPTLPLPGIFAQSSVHIVKVR